MSRWIFLDVGNIVLDEDPLVYHAFRLHWEAVHRVRPETTFLDLLAQREAHAARGSRWPVYEAVSAVLDDAACAQVWDEAEHAVRSRFGELSPLIAGAAEVIEALSRRFRLGLIANQGAECREHLARLGIFSRFEVVVFSDELGMAKPDPRLFELAIARAGASADRCTMVGDRLDNDIEPAAALGMPTVWVRWPRRAEKGWRPVDPDALAFRDSLERSATRASALWRGAVPSQIVDRIADLDAPCLP